MGRLNIVFIMADDMGYGDLGCYNPESKIPTPNMDRLAAEGMRFTDAHAPSAVCTPTRYGVLTGRYCWRTHLKHGVIGGYDAPLIDQDRLTLAAMLKAQGYATACIGKWHVGVTFHDKDGNPTEAEEQVDFSKPIEGGPTDLGFDYSLINAACGTCSPPYGFIENTQCLGQPYTWFQNAGNDVGDASGMRAKDWVTKDADLIITEKACDYIKEQAVGEKPFFLYLTPNAPHEPCMEEFVPDFARGRSTAGSRGDLVWLFDWTVGRVTEALEQAGVADSTLVILTSDNGPLPGDFRLGENGNRAVMNTEKRNFLFNDYGHKTSGDLRGHKAHIWDGGHRVPYLVRWPGAVSPGTTSDELICLTDTMASCAAVAGCEDLPANAAEDSCNVLPALLGKTTDDERIREAVIHHSSFGVFSIRQGRWKMVLDCPDSGGWPTPRGSKPVSGTPGQLYDMLADPAEENNLWDQCGDTVTRLTQLLNQYRSSDRSAPIFRSAVNE